MNPEQSLAPIDEPSPSLAVEKHVLSGIGDLIEFTNGTYVILNIENAENMVPRDRDSARVHTHVLSEYKWASEECYRGRILAAHRNFVAYRLFNESTGEAVRVLERMTSKRHLIKSFKYPTADIQWAVHAPLLAVLDINANLYVYHVGENCIVTKYLNIIRHDNAVPSGLTPRLSWCPYIHDLEEPHENVYMVAVYFGSTVEVFSLNSVKNALRTEEVTLEESEYVDDGYAKLPIDDANADVQAVCLSPDATAIAIAHDNGTVTFFILESEGTKFAHRWQPEHGRRIQSLAFLDNVDNTETPEQFWKYAITTTDDGKRINMYDTENWHCIARLLFEPADRITKLVLGMDPTARFIFLTDYDAANIYCIEIAYLNSIPRFSACTEVTFCHPLVNAVPLSLIEQPQQDFSLDDEEDSKVNLVVTFVALSQRSLLHLEIDLESAYSQQNGDERAHEVKVDTSFQRAISVGESAANGNSAAQSIRDDEGIEAIYRNLQSLKDKIDKQSEYFERRMLEESERANSILEQIREDFVSRDERLYLKLESLVTENRSATIESVQTSLDVKLNDVLQGLKETINENMKLSDSQQRPSMDPQKIADEVKRNVQEALYTVIVPETERVVTQMFTELNETFRKGLQEYMEQLRSLTNKSAVKNIPSSNSEMYIPATSELAIDVNEGRYASAFEKALILNNLSALVYVCKRVDPDLIGTDKARLPQHILLCVLNQIATDLHLETTLKLRYIEIVLMTLNIKEPSIAEGCNHVLNRLHCTMIAFLEDCKILHHKRRAQVIMQLINGLRRHKNESSF